MREKRITKSVSAQDKINTGSPLSWDSKQQ